MSTSAEDLPGFRLGARTGDLAGSSAGTASTRPPLTYVPLSTRPLPPLDDTIPPWPGDYVDSSGVRLHVRRTPGPDSAAAVYVHGLGGSATNWTDLAGQLSGFATGFAVDLPGFGRSRPPVGYTFTLTEQATTVAGFIRGLGVGPVHLFGNSMGGAIAMLVAADDPDLVRTLTLISPAVPDFRPVLSRVSDPLLPLTFLPLIGTRARRRMTALTPRERAEQLVRLCFANASEVPEHRKDEAANEIAELAEQAWSRPALEQSTLGLVRAWLVPRSRSLWTVAPKVRVPTLVVWGSEDKLVTVRKGPRTAQALPRGRLLVLPRTGHVAQMERPVTVARAVLGMWECDIANSW